MKRDKGPSHGYEAPARQTVMIAAGLAALAGAAAFVWHEQATRNPAPHRRPDSAPGRTARRKRFGRYMDNIKQTDGVGADSPHALREALMAVRKGGRMSIPGVYGGFTDKFPMGALMEKELQIRTGQTHVQKYLPDLLRRIGEGEFDTTFLISHHLPLEKAAEGYRNFRCNQNDWTKVMLKPGTMAA